MAHLDGAARHGVENLKRRDDFTAAVDLDLEAAVACRGYLRGQVLGRHAESRELRWPGRDAGPFEGLPAALHLALAIRAVLRAGRESRRGRKPTHKLSPFHAAP